MIQLFQVKNFKGFKESLIWKTHPRKYAFNEEGIQQGLVKNAVIYDENGQGKSNFIYALMDITTHLTDFNIVKSHYIVYQNLNAIKNFSEFHYEFCFDNAVVTYTYKKYSMSEIFDEQLLIDGKVIVLENYKTNERIVKLKGAEQLQITERDLSLSFIKYIFNNTQLDHNDATVQIFLKFKNFVEGMLYLSTGTSELNMYQGVQSGNEEISHIIVKSGQLQNLEQFLKHNGINYHLASRENDEGKYEIIVKFSTRSVNIYHVASHGTKVLIYFFYWLNRTNDITFIAIDEFDAFFHNEVAKHLLKTLRNSHVQSVFTTHNTTIMSNDLLRPDCYYIMKNGKIKTIAESTDKELRFAHDLEKMYNAGAFDE